MKLHFNGKTIGTWVAPSLALILMLTPCAAMADGVGIADMFAPVTSMLKEIVNLLIFTWGYYLGILALAVQGIRCWQGKIGLDRLGIWAIGITIVFFAPNLVSYWKNKAAQQQIAYLFEIAKSHIA
ncbi:TrbC/VirB2 family protein [Chromobacterium vaccinii]|uniref:TrbC/VirB2 family protein n=1 Tax=Chromobacterium vaccinii TaxID=1108595 RepID=UPI0034580351